MISFIGNLRVILENVEIFNVYFWKKLVKFNKIEYLFGIDFVNICKYF